jgi:hypothetical protein
MAIELNQLIASYCAELLRAHSTFLIMQRSAYVDMFREEFNRLALDDRHFLGLDEVSFSVYLRPKRRPRLMEWWYRLQRRPVLPMYELVPPLHPEAIHCTVIFRRTGSEFKSSVTLGDNNENKNIYVDLT